MTSTRGRRERLLLATLLTAALAAPGSVGAAAAQGDPATRPCYDVTGGGGSLDRVYLVEGDGTVPRAGETDVVDVSFRMQLRAPSCVGGQYAFVFHTDDGVRLDDKATTLAGDGTSAELSVTFRLDGYPRGADDDDADLGTESRCVYVDVRTMDEKGHIKDQAPDVPQSARVCEDGSSATTSWR